MKRVLSLVLAVALCLIGIVGCGGAETITIGAIPQDPSVEFYTLMVEGYEAGAKEMGVELDVQYSNNSVEEETRLTEAFISQGSSGVIVNPIDSVAIAGPIQKAKNADKHIVLTDVTPEDDPGATAIVTSDNYSGGYAAGEMMMEMIPEGGKIIMTKFKFSSIAMDDRYNGFQDAIKGSNLVIVDTIDVDGTREDTLAKITPMLTKYPDLAGIFCSQGDPAIGCLAAVDAANMSDQVTIISYDVESEVAEAIKQGSAIKGGVTQFPYVMGYEAVRQMVRAIRGEEYEKLIELPVVPVTKDNVQELIDDSAAFLKKYGGYDLEAGK
ncbi:MAG: sugar ABC transporter substrate-binding protein [Christensenellaceae bacterium]|nr:sugar ABC transporter substrate-binding protein [Christensenellaceae bacterium]